MENAFIVLEETAQKALIEKLLKDDPRLISKHTNRQYKSVLLAFNTWRNDRPITKTLVEQYAAHLQAEGKSPNIINQRLAAIRWYARKIADLAADYAGDEEVMKHAARVATVQDVKGERPERGRHVEQGEMAALIELARATAHPLGSVTLLSLPWHGQQV